jgi:hypothetical protein
MIKKWGLFWLLMLVVCGAWSFNFSEEEAKDKAKQSAKPRPIASRLTPACRNSLKDKRVLVLIGERHNNREIASDLHSYGPHTQAINKRLRAMGLQTFTTDELEQQIGQPGVDAYFHEQRAAAVAAAQKLGADFIMRGVISSSSATNRMIGVKEVYTRVAFALSDFDGRSLADASASNDSYSGRDTLGMALTLVNEQADRVIADLYSEYCKTAGIVAQGAAR